MISDSEARVAESEGAWPDLLARACASTRGVLAGATEALVNHIVGAMQFFADLAELGSSPGRELSDRNVTGRADGLRPSTGGDLLVVTT